MSNKRSIYLSLGTNIGDRKKNLRQALLRLRKVMALELVSAVYETEPWGPIQEQDTFFNICVSGTTRLEPIEFLDAAKEIEQKIGRLDGLRWGPRLIDIDLLFYENVQLITERLIVPHKEVAGRAFVLVPLAEIAPELLHPVLNKTISSLKEQLPKAEVQTVVKKTTLDL